MLDGLDDINWSQFKHAYGNASDVPDDIRALLSPDAETVSDALGRCCGNLHHQGTVYEATAYAVPFLVEFLTLTDFPEKLNLLYYLIEFTNGHSYLDVHQRHYDIEERESDDFKRRLAQELQWVQAAYDAVANHLDVYFHLMDEAEEEIRCLVIELLGQLPSNQADILPRFKQTLSTETSILVKASILHAMRYFSGVVDDLMPYTHVDVPPLMRFCAAESIMYRSKDETPQVIIDLLMDMFIPDDVMETQYWELPWQDGSISLAISMNIRQLSSERAEACILRIVDKFTSANWEEIVLLTEMLLYLILHDDTGYYVLPSADDLTDLQRHVLENVYQYALLPNRADDDLEFYLNAYDLPLNSESFRQFLD